MTDTQYLAPSTLDEAISAYAAADGAGRILAGGTDLLVQMQAGMVEPGLIVDIKNIAELTSIEGSAEGGFVVGATVKGGAVAEVRVTATRAGRLILHHNVPGQEPIDPEHPLLGLDNVLCTPHLGASTSEAQERVAVEIAEQAVAYLQLGIVKNAVNVPTLPPETAARLAPYLEVAKGLGRIVGQLEPVDVRELRVTCTGEAGELGVTPIARAALAPGAAITPPPGCVPELHIYMPLIGDRYWA